MTGGSAAIYSVYRGDAWHSRIIRNVLPDVLTWLEQVRKSPLQERPDACKPLAWVILIDAQSSVLEQYGLLDNRLTDGDRRYTVSDEQMNSLETLFQRHGTLLEEQQDAPPYL